MSAPTDDEFGFAPDYDSPVPYMQRTRDCASGFFSGWNGASM